MVTLDPMNHEEFQQYIRHAIKDYAKDKILSGNWSEEEAMERAENEFSRLLPKGEKTEFNHLYSIFDDEQLIGMIWIAPESSTNYKEGFIYDFVIWEQFQGQGYGTQAMKEIEVKAKELGMQKIRLHVFGHNQVARGLYEKMGYEITNIKMVKSI